MIVLIFGYKLITLIFMRKAFKVTFQIMKEGECGVMLVFVKARARIIMRSK